jgi:dihydroorotate dehydrogenase (NAD+) catalytic subunit
MSLRNWGPVSIKNLVIKAPFTIPSGIVTTQPGVISHIAEKIDEIGFLTTKTLSLEPRSGYREPVVHEYHDGCYVNAVGLANPGAVVFRSEMEKYLPLYGGKPLLVSIMGGDSDEFLKCAQVLAPIADAFELNFSCPHVKGAGQSVGSDPDAVAFTIQLLKQSFEQPIIPKLSPNLPNVVETALLCEKCGADALSLINTVGPGVSVDNFGNPVLSNIVGGLSGAGIFPIGLKIVKEAASAVRIPIIASGGISSYREANAYAKAGATLFGIGSALAYRSTEDIIELFSAMRCEQEHQGRLVGRHGYHKTKVLRNTDLGSGMFLLELQEMPACSPGEFFFLRSPGQGEKPFSPAFHDPPGFIIRAIGQYTKFLRNLVPDDEILLRGPCGNSLKTIYENHFVLVAGGTGVAPALYLAEALNIKNIPSYFGFSAPISNILESMIRRALPNCRIIIDGPGEVGSILTSLEKDLADSHENGEKTFFLCGPQPMMKACTALIRSSIASPKILISREDIMKCGIGICGSCGTSGGLRSCVDGPIMAAEQ